MAMTLITTNTSSDAASSDFTTGIDNTYKLYIFKWYDVGPATDGALLMLNFSTDGGSNYNMTKTTSYFLSQHTEADGDATLAYVGASDLAQSVAVQKLTGAIGSAADESAAGELFLFNPSNTTYVKHFYSRSNNYGPDGYTQDVYVAGYVNSTSDIDAVQFAMSSGNMDAVIKMYGVG